MDIVLKRPIEELTPKLIEFNNEQLMEEAKNYLAKYENMIFDDNSIVQAKEVKANINKISSELNKWRIGIQKIYETPSKNFKAQVDEVIALFDETSKKIGDIVDDYTQRQKQEKKDLICSIYDNIFGSLATMIPIEKVYNSKWENKTYREEQIKQDIESLYTQINQDLEAIYSMSNIDHISVKFLYFKFLNLSLALTEYKREEEHKTFLKEQEDKKKAEIIDWNKKVEKGVIDEPTPLQEPLFKKTSEERILSLSFKCELTLQQAKDLKQFFIDNQIKYEKI